MASNNILGKKGKTWTIVQCLKMLIKKGESTNEKI